VLETLSDNRLVMSNLLVDLSDGMSKNMDLLGDLLLLGDILYSSSLSNKLVDVFFDVHNLLAELVDLCMGLVDSLTELDNVSLLLLGMNTSKGWSGVSSDFLPQL